LFSGLGITQELFAPQQAIPARVEVVPWLRPQSEDTLRTYAHRLAATVVPAADDAPMYLGGVSFGAMIALEAAAVLRPRGVFIIAGARSGRALSPIVQTACRFACRMPEPMLAAGLRAAPLLVRMTGRPNRVQREFLLGLARRTLPWLIRWGCRAMRDWQAPADLACPAHHIHGSDDRMIPLENLRPPPDVVIPGGGHIINVTHAAQVNTFITDRLIG